MHYTHFSVWLRNRLILAESEPVLGQTEKSCLAQYYRQFSTNIKIRTDTRYVCLGLRLFGSNKTGYYFMIFYFTIRDK